MQTAAIEDHPVQAKANEFKQDDQAGKLQQCHASRGQPLGKGEVESSILSCSTSNSRLFREFRSA
jgi:hypothetical protein